MSYSANSDINSRQYDLVLNVDGYVAMYLVLLLYFQGF